MRSIFRGVALALALSALGGAALAQGDAKKDDPVAPAAGVAPGASAALAEPRPGETNGERAKTQPGNNAPFWRGVRNSGTAPGTVNNAAAGEKGVLVQEFVQYPGSRLTTAGEAWRQVRNQWIIPYGGSLVLIVALAIALYYFARGPLGGHEPDTGRKIERFTYFERAAHWSNAVAFVVLAVSGLVMAFGKFLLLPIIGATLLGWLSYVLKTAHNFAGPLFAVSLVIVFLTFLRSNMPSRDDLAWLRKGGGLFGGEEPPSHRFNAGEKLVFWFGVFLLGGFIVGSGLVLDQLLPGLLYARGDMQIAHLIHSVAAMLITAVFLGHIYIGTIGMRGSYQAMKTGVVDEGWAREHHAYWYEDIRDGKIPAQRSAPPAGRLEQPAA
ncbi:MAG: formate dehydrogenase subunit gamma [Burkholderiales bacterium]|nr:formate dehydrogenase subunit gamma [Burkholderiales bacterium]